MLSKSFVSFSVATFVSILLITSLMGCKNTSNPTKNKMDGDTHQQMIDLLTATRIKLSNAKNAYDADARLADCNQKLAMASSAVDQINLLSLKSNIMLEIGNEAEAVKILEGLETLLKSDPSGRKQIYQVLGMAYLRLAERNNCVNHHDDEACIMPIQGGGHSPG